MFLHVHHLVRGIKLRVFRKQGVIKNPDVVRRHDIGIIIPAFKVPEEPAQIREGAVVPEILLPDLQFDVNDRRAVEQDLDIKDVLLVPRPAAEFDRIEHRYGLHFFRCQAEQCAGQPSQHLFVGLHDYVEHTVVHQRVVDRPGGILKRACLYVLCVLCVLLLLFVFHLVILSRFYDCCSQPLVITL